ncbi:SDR family NAD(P)-dependent oxidoreductase [Shewanella sp. 1_MG-2023]|uniref:SDR family NAD(P)-dependent oxidoreductase n=1 Tax=unclassified Shewanella TaxID=196818 RepID=UPI0026E42AE6|nr:MULTISPECIES: SDR family NAD(P)-dependent oxidoreductase [unclassified Shewanella]MDO6609952.1 SDR family NAD(P)-dependent oxidoreductase [Shewanella sp. 7_MG-2023]MDO6769906.1 SDR family NAD(P)-dependent oxidoreductase [Shewanella sp. 2_MG-2023]MDO6792970.1 SDR family NAD(P)-dependent oxidoreductase [Shewanella sp. 1_MG-2023]
MSASMKQANSQHAVLITGASSGIGFALAMQYVAEGYQVFACGRNAQRLNTIKGATPLVFDINDKHQIEQAAEQLTHHLQQDNLTLKMVILNAGSCEYINNPVQFDGALFERVIQTNVISMGYCLEHFLPLIAVNGRVGLMSSSATYLPFPKAEAYGASKAAVNYLASSLRLDLKAHGIGVSVICPGFVKTPLTDKNDFAMPMQISADKAATAIMHGMQTGKSEIHFPKRFTYLLKLMSCLPSVVINNMLTPKADKA